MSKLPDFTFTPISVPFRAEDEMPYIFISYAHADRERVFPVIKDLYEKGLHIWYDQGIEITSKYDDAIASHVKNCAVVLAFVSNASVTRDYVETELMYALEGKKPIVFCMLDKDASLSDGISLRTANRAKYPRVAVSETYNAVIAAGSLTPSGKRKAIGIDITPVNPPGPDDEYDFEHTVSGSIRLRKYKALKKNVVIPSSLEGVPVTELRGTFSGNDRVRSVVIPSGVSVIAYGTFEKCPNLKEITVPDSVISVKSRGIALDEGLSFTIVCSENSYIHKYAKRHKIPVRLEDLSAARKDTNADDIPFRSDRNLPFVYCSYAHEDKDLVFPFMTRLHDMGYSIRYDELTRDGLDCASDISNCRYFIAFLTPSYIKGRGMKELRLSSSEKRIICYLEKCSLPGDIALHQDSVQGLCTWTQTTDDILTTIANHLEKNGCHGNRALPIPNFEYSVSPSGIVLTKYLGNESTVEIKPSYLNRPVTAVGSAFKKCEGLKKIVMPDSIASIGAWAFQNCRELTDIKLPQNLTTVENNAFYRCDSLTSVFIPENVREIGDRAFGACKVLQCIEVSPKNKHFTSSKGVLLSADKKTLISCPAGKSGRYSVKRGISSLGSGAFFGCSDIDEIVLPRGLKEIGSRCFEYCDALTQVTVPDSVRSIGQNAFANCPSLTVRCSEGSCAWKYCEENNIPHTAKKKSSLKWLLPVILLLIAAAVLQLSDTVDIIGFLSDLF